MDGKLTILATTSIGPETPNDNHDQRYLNCVTTTWKITDKLTSITDLNYARDDGANADAYGIAQYFTYAINSWLTAGIRGEVFSDQQGFYVISFANTHALGHQQINDPYLVELARRQRGRFVTFDTRAAAHSSEIVDVIPG